jgi:hypothetical protein
VVKLSISSFIVDKIELQVILFASLSSDNIETVVKFAYLYGRPSTVLNKVSLKDDKPVCNHLTSSGRQASFIKPLMAEQRRHVSCVGDGGD